MKKKILLVCENRYEGKNLKELMESWGYELKFILDANQFLKTIDSEKPHIIVSESKFSNADAMEILRTIKSSFEIPVIFLEREDSIENAVLALKTGTDDYFSQPVDIVRLKKVLENASQKIDVMEEAQNLNDQLNNLRTLNGRLIGNSSKMLEIFNQIELCSPSDASVFVTGASGTGKELVARSIHEHSSRKNGPFIAINCSAIPENLLESEIFGHEKGSFTGAIKRKEGCFELAHNGTLFLDEIIEMAPDLQSKLLRVLENGKFRRVGGTEELSSNVRLLAASNKNIAEVIKTGKFREDLFYRLNVFLIDLPPLRERVSDIALLTQHFIEELNLKTGKNIVSADPKVFDILKKYEWPGNVRELRNVIERAVIIANDDVITQKDLPSYIKKKDEQSGPALVFEIGNSKMQDIEHTIILRTLEHLNGNKSETAKTLGMSLKTLYNKLNTINN